MSWGLGAVFRVERGKISGIWTVPLKANRLSKGLKVTLCLWLISSTTGGQRVRGH